MTVKRKDTVVTVNEIIIYPIKGCRGLSIPKTFIQSSGLMHDRSWILSDSSNSQITEKSEPNLSQIVLSMRGENIWLSAVGMCDLMLAAPDNRCVLASEWLADFLKTSCTLLPTSLDVQSMEQQPISLISSPSLNALNNMLATPFNRLRFRPNLVVSGKFEAFGETGWNSLKSDSLISDVMLNDAGNCVRPHMLCGDLPWSSKLNNRQEAMRRRATTASGNLIFGKYFSTGSGGLLQINDKLLAA